MRKPPPWIHSYPGDVELAQHLGMDGFTLVRLRRNLYEQYAALSRFERVAFEGADREQRWGYLVARLADIWGTDDLHRMNAWRQYLGYDDEEWLALIEGGYPVDLDLVEETSALFGITESFVLFGTPPAPATYLIEPRQASRGGTT